MKKTIKIESYRQVAPICENPAVQQKTIRVAAYTYVSPVNNDWDDRENSLNNQSHHYETLISANPNWEYVGMYADVKIGTVITRNRQEFDRLFDDCKAGKIDLIVVESASYFGNEIGDLVKMLKSLQNLGTPVGVYFEDNNINTLDADGKHFIDVLAMFTDIEDEYERLHLIQRQKYLTKT